MCEGITPDVQREVDWTMVLPSTFGLGRAARVRQGNHAASTDTFVQWDSLGVDGVIALRCRPIAHPVLGTGRRRSESWRDEHD